MSRRKRYYRPIEPEAVNTTETALANLRPQLANALKNVEYYTGKDWITAANHAGNAKRLQAEITKLEGNPDDHPTA